MIAPPSAPIREVILCVDDEAGVVNVLKEQLEDAFGEGCEVEAATSGSSALELASGLDPASEPLAVIIADQMMPGMTGTELLGKLHGQHPGLRKVLLTGQAGLDAVVFAVNHYGLDLYIAKPWAETDLRLSVAGLLRQFRLEQENLRLLDDLRRKNLELETLNASLEAQVRERTRALEEANAKLERLAVTDGLTGLYNHRFFQERLAQEVERARRSGEPVTLIMIDVDHFKRWNDAHGHLAGDGALRQLAALLTAGRRLNDVAARYGGEEFAVILSGTPRKAGALVAEYLRRRVADSRFDPLPAAGGFTISAGVACCPDDAADPTALVQAADRALYRAKSEGRNRVVEA
jgi:diguanylate cyclase (GGDEF)-like protein